MAAPQVAESVALTVGMAAVAEATASPTSEGNGLLVHAIESTRCVAYPNSQLVQFPSDLWRLVHLVSLNLRGNQLTRLPGETIASTLTSLEQLDVSFNLLFVLEDILALSVLRSLARLDFSNNPIRLVSNRIYLLQQLLQAAAPSDKELRTIKLGLQQRQSPSLLKLLAMARDQKCGYVTLLPRNSGFCLLVGLNGHWITDSEVRCVDKEMGRRTRYVEAGEGCRRVSSAASLLSRRSSQSQGTAPVVIDCCQPASIPTSSSMPKSSSTPPATGLAPKADDKPCERARHFDGSRMTFRELMALQKAGKAVHDKPTIHRFQFVVDEVKHLKDAADHVRDGAESEADANVEEEEEEDEEADQSDRKTKNQTKRQQAAVLEQEIVDELEESEHRTMLRRSSDVQRTHQQQWLRHFLQQRRAGDRYRVARGVEEQPTLPFVPRPDEFEDSEELSREEKHVVREYLKLNCGFRGDSGRRTPALDAWFFKSSVFLDVMTQRERSRKLTQEAVEFLSDDHAASKRCRELKQTLARGYANESTEKEYQTMQQFCNKSVVAGDLCIQSDVASVVQNDHLQQRHEHEPLLSKSSGQFDLDRATDNCLSRVKLQNAVDLAASIMKNKQGRRMIQNLIEKDQKAIEEERIALERKKHEQRLELIYNWKKYARASTEQHREKPRTHFASPWQERNYKAKEFEMRQQARNKMDAALKSTTSTTGGAGAKETTDPKIKQSSTLYKTIESVDQVTSSDCLVGVSSHDLMLKCSEIAQNAQSDLDHLERFKHSFLKEEADWQQMRQDPVNLLKRRIKRRNQQEFKQQELQIGSTHVVYSSLFQ